eukprot:2875350-Amphidinium_carterae.1
MQTPKKWSGILKYVVKEGGKFLLLPVPASHISIVVRYATSLHWSLTQFTPASMEVRASSLDVVT